MPLVMAGRRLHQPMAATRVARGTDVNFGALTRALLKGVDLRPVSYTHLTLPTICSV